MNLAAETVVQVVRFDAGTITAFFGGLAALLVAVGTVIAQLRQVHKVVNSNFDEQREEIASLRAALGDTPSNTTKGKQRATAAKKRRAR